MIKNALKFTRQNGHIVIFAAFDAEATMLRVCVSDNGKGIQKSEQVKIF